MSDQTTPSGITFSGLLQITFIVLKLIGKISWSWWWVLCPMWIGAGLVIIVLLVTTIVLWRAKERENRDRKKRIQTMQDYKKEIHGLRPGKWQQRLKELQNRKS